MKPGAHLFDHTVQFWRPTEGKDETTRRVERTMATLGDPVDAAVQSDRRSLQTLGPGETEVGRWKVYLTGGPEVREGDICEVVSGPEAQRELKVEEAYEPRGRFRQIRCSNWEGKVADMLEAS